MSETGSFGLGKSVGEMGALGGPLRDWSLRLMFVVMFGAEMLIVRLSKFLLALAVRSAGGSSGIGGVLLSFQIFRIANKLVQKRDEFPPKNSIKTTSLNRRLRSLLISIPIRRHRRRAR